jgi:hypothetical protein
MPPRKSDVAKATSEEVAVGAPSASTPAKEAAHKEKDGVNIEVRAFLRPLPARTLFPSSNRARIANLWMKLN